MSWSEIPVEGIIRRPRNTINPAQNDPAGDVLIELGPTSRGLEVLIILYVKEVS